jgi:hypothetical protein
MRRVFLALMGFGCLTVGPGGGTPVDAQVKPVPIPGGVADPDGRVGYVVNVDGMRIDAIDLATGRTLWTSSELGRPIVLLIAWDQRLAVRSGGTGHSPDARVQLLDTAARGRRVRELPPLAVPEWARRAGPHNPALRLTAREVSNGWLILDWSVESRPQIGVDPRVVNGGAAAPRRAEGAVAVNPEDGTSRPASEPPRGSGGGGEGARPAGLESLVSHPYQQGGGFRSDPMAAGRYLAALEVRQEGGGPTLVLRRWDRQTGHPLASVPLASAGAVTPVRSTDGEYLLVPSGAGQADGPLSYRLVGVAPGRPSPELRPGGTVESAVVSGDRAYVQTVAAAAAGRPRPRALVAFSLPGGERLWEHPVEPAPPTAPRPRRPG